MVATRDLFMSAATSVPRCALLQAVMVNSFLKRSTRKPALIVWLIMSVSPSRAQVLLPSET